MTLTQESATPRRTAGAPISWGVCEVPNWGIQLPIERVLSDMNQLGLQATEFGPAGFLPVSPVDKNELLRRYELSAVGGFLPTVLHDSAIDPMGAVDPFIDDCVVSGAGVMVLAASTGVEGYDLSPVLDDRQWTILLHNLDRIADYSQSRGVRAVVHPHIGTLIESADEVDRVLAGSRIGLCIDTGHLVAAGADPVAITVANAKRVGHVHLKDVDGAVAAQFRAKKLTFSEAVAAGLFCVLGTGSVNFRSMIKALDQTGYKGWYVLEHDVMLTAADVADKTPIANMRAALEFLTGISA